MSLIARGGVRWLGAYGVVIAMGATAAAMSVAITVALFRTIGPKRTRLAAQILAAVIARGVHHRAAGRRDPVARLALAHGVSRIRHAGRARAGDRQPVVAGRHAPRLAISRRSAIVLGGSLVLLGGAILIFSARFGDHGDRGLQRAASGRGRRSASASAAARPRARCGRRNGRCCCAIRGSCRRR